MKTFREIKTNKLYKEGDIFEFLDSYTADRAGGSVSCKSYIRMPLVSDYVKLLINKGIIEEVQKDSYAYLKIDKFFEYVKELNSEHPFEFINTLRDIYKISKNAAFDFIMYILSDIERKNNTFYVPNSFYYYNGSYTAISHSSIIEKVPVFYSIEANKIAVETANTIIKYYAEKKLKEE